MFKHYYFVFDIYSELLESDSWLFKNIFTKNNVLVNLLRQYRYQKSYTVHEFGLKALVKKGIDCLINISDIIQGLGSAPDLATCHSTDSFVPGKYKRKVYYILLLSVKNKHEENTILLLVFILSSNILK